MRNCTKITQWLSSHLNQAISITFKLAVIALAVVAVSILCITIEGAWDKQYGRYGGRTINEKYHIDVQYFNDGTERLRNMKTGKWTTPKERWFANEPERDSISVYCDRKGKRGFYNTHTGKITIKGSYLHAWCFSDGVAGVVDENERLLFIGHDGSQAVPGSYHYSSGSEYIFKDGVCQMYNDSTGKSGILRIDGIWAMDPVYDYISDIYEGGYRITAKDGEWHLWNADYTMAFPEGYSKITMASDGLGVYVVNKQDHTQMLVNYEGAVLQPFTFDNIYELKNMTKYHEDENDEFELSPDVVAYQVDEWEGLMDKRTGQILTLPQFHDFKMISKTLVAAQYERCQGGQVVMDLKGNIVGQD